MYHYKLYKPAVVFLFLYFQIFSAGATNYYIATAGNDTNSGTAPDQAWQTLQKLNDQFDVLLPGDTVFFKRGDTFFGGIICTRSGTPLRPIVFTAYGDGEMPVISGFVTINGWQKKEAHTWQAAAPGISSNLNMLTLNNRPQHMGRYPNAETADGGFLRYEDFSATASITDNELDAAVNWTGAELIIRKNHWTLERCRVTRQQDKTLTYTYACNTINLNKTPPLYEGTKGNGYFIQKHYRTLDLQGEWFFDSLQQKMMMVLADTHCVVKAAAVDTLVNMKGHSAISFMHLAFEGANITALLNSYGSDISIAHCRFANIGAKAIQFWNTANVKVEYSSFKNVLSNTILIRNGKKDNVTVRHCVIENNAPYPGMGSFFDGSDYKALVVMVKNNAVIENNVIDSCGSSGIQFQGSDVTVQHNLIYHYCHVLDDGGGIYTFVDANPKNPGTPFTNRLIKENIILYGLGCNNGSTGIKKAEGIYLDDGTMNVEVTGNTIAYVSNKAFALNTPHNITLRKNTCFNNGGGWGTHRKNSWQPFGKLDIRHNVFFETEKKQTLLNFIYTGLDKPDKLTIWEAIKLSGDIDSNYYNIVNPVSFLYSYSKVEGKAFTYPSALTFERWQDFAGQDVHSKNPMENIPGHLLKSTSNKNLVTNGGFDKGTDDVVSYGGGAASGQWDNTGKITGPGSLKLECGEPRANWYITTYGNIGKVYSGKKYLLKFKTAGESDCGIIRVYLRRKANPQTPLTAIVTSTFGIATRQHEFLLEAQATDDANFVIEVERNSCTTYLDDIELYEAEGEIIDVNKYIRFECNPTEKEKTILLSKKYRSVSGTQFTDRVVLPPFSSTILIEDSSYR